MTSALFNANDFETNNRCLVRLEQWRNPTLCETKVSTPLHSGCPKNKKEVKPNKTITA
jgi:hypothetical protein